MPFKVKGVTHRRWKRPTNSDYGRITIGQHGLVLVQTQQSRRLMSLMGKAMKAGKAVTFAVNTVQPPVDEKTGKSKTWDGAPYDTIDMEIED